MVYLKPKGLHEFGSCDDEIFIDIALCVVNISHMRVDIPYGPDRHSKLIPEDT